jgi:hypothetical protein
MIRGCSFLAFLLHADVLVEGFYRHHHAAPNMLSRKWKGVRTKEADTFYDGDIASTSPLSKTFNTSPSTLYSDDGYTLSAPQRYSVVDWFENLLNIPSSQIIQRIQSHLYFNFVWSIIVTALFVEEPTLPTSFIDTIPVAPVFDKLNLYLPFAMSSGILGVLLAFRTSQSYDRFWEGREIWATVIAKSRSLARNLMYLDDPDPEYMKRATRWLEAFPIALMQHLQVYSTFL